MVRALACVTYLSLSISLARRTNVWREDRMRFTRKLLSWPWAGVWLLLLVLLSKRFRFLLPPFEPRGRNPTFAYHISICEEKTESDDSELKSPLFALFPTLFPSTSIWKSPLLGKTPCLCHLLHVSFILPASTINTQLTKLFVSKNIHLFWKRVKNWMIWIFTDLYDGTL